MTKISYSGYRFPPEIIHQAIWLYLRFTLSFRDVEDLLAERGIAISYETIRRWVSHCTTARWPRPSRLFWSWIARLINDSPPSSIVGFFHGAIQPHLDQMQHAPVNDPGYFGFCQTPRVLTNLEAWIRRRLRLYLWRQWRTGQNRFKELCHRGISKFNAAVAAGSPRASGSPLKAAKGAWF